MGKTIVLGNGREESNLFLTGEIFFGEEVAQALMKIWIKNKFYSSLLALKQWLYPDMGYYFLIRFSKGVMTFLKINPSDPVSLLGTP